MNISNFGRSLASTLFRVAILVVPVLLATNLVFGKPDTPKKVLKDSGIYSSFSDGLVQQVTEDKKQAPADQPPNPADAVKDPIVQNAIKKTLTPEFAQSTAEQVLDGTYHWLDGTTTKPDFNVDLSGLKTNLANAIGDGGLAHVQSLPVCTLQQMQQIDVNTIDPLALPCLPPGVNLQTERQKLVNDALNNGDVLEDTSLTADTLKGEGQTQSPFEKASVVPKLFQWSKVLPWVLGIAGLVAAVGVVMLDEERRHGIKSLSRTVLVVGIILLVAVGIGKFLVAHMQIDESVAKSPAIQQSVVYIITTLNNAFGNVLLVFALVYILGGSGGLAWLHFTRLQLQKDRPKPGGPIPANQKVK